MDLFDYLSFLALHNEQKMNTLSDGTRIAPCASRSVIIHFEGHMRTLILGVLVPVLMFIRCSTTSNNAAKHEEIKYDYVAGYSGDDQIIVKDESASIHSDRDAVGEYTTTVSTINGERQRVEADLAGLALCRKAKAEVKGVLVKEGPLNVPCMKKVVMDRERAGEDLMQVKGKLVLRKKDDFKSRLDEARACLDESVAARDRAREDYMLEGCDKPIMNTAASFE